MYSVANLDPTGIASTVINIAALFKEQYDKMKENKEACEGLNKQVNIILVQRIVVSWLLGWIGKMLKVRFSEARRFMTSFDW